MAANATGPSNRCTRAPQNSHSLRYWASHRPRDRLRNQRIPSRIWALNRLPGLLQSGARRRAPRDHRWRLSHLQTHLFPTLGPELSAGQVLEVEHRRWRSLRPRKGQQSVTFGRRPVCISAEKVGSFRINHWRFGICQRARWRVHASVLTWCRFSRPEWYIHFACFRAATFRCSIGTG